MVSDLVEIPD